MFTGRASAACPSWAKACWRRRRRSGESAQSEDLVVTGDGVLPPFERQEGVALVVPSQQVIRSQFQGLIVGSDRLLHALELAKDVAPVAKELASRGSRATALS